MVGQRIAVRVRPGARRTTVGGTYPGPYGPALVVAVTAPAVDGRANTATIEAVAAALDLRRRQISITVGATARDKLLDIDDTPADLPERVTRLLGS